MRIGILHSSVKCSFLRPEGHPAQSPLRFTPGRDLRPHHLRLTAPSVVKNSGIGLVEVGGQPVVFNARAQMLEARRAVSRCFFQRKGAKRLRPLGTVRQGGLVCFFKPHGARERGGGAIIDRAPKGDDGGCPLGDRGTNYPDTIQIKAGGRGLVELIQRFSRKKAQRS